MTFSIAEAVANLRAEASALTGGDVHAARELLLRAAPNGIASEEEYDDAMAFIQESEEP